MRVLVCLHGWGGSKESFTELRAALEGNEVMILTPDLPGFGGEQEPKKAWSTDDYADWVNHWIKKELAKTAGVHGIRLLGHSHGGRIAIKLACRQAIRRKNDASNDYVIERLYLCAAAGIRHPRHLKRIIGLTLAKTGKLFLQIPVFKKLQPIGKKLLYKLVRVHDYEQASPVMRQTLINVSAENLRPLLKTIDVPTDLFWGRQDGMTPFSDALVMEKEIPNAVLHSFEGVKHAVHRDRSQEIAKVIRATLSAR